MNDDQRVQSAISRMSLVERLDLAWFSLRYDLASYTRRLNLRRLLGALGIGAALAIAARVVEVWR